MDNWRFDTIFLYLVRVYFWAQSWLFETDLEFLYYKHFRSPNLEDSATSKASKKPDSEVWSPKCKPKSINWYIPCSNLQYPFSTDLVAVATSKYYSITL